MRLYRQILTGLGVCIVACGLLGLFGASDSLEMLSWPSALCGMAVLAGAGATAGGPFERILRNQRGAQSPPRPVSMMRSIYAPTAVVVAWLALAVSVILFSAAVTPILAWLYLGLGLLLVLASVLKPGARRQP